MRLWEVERRTCLSSFCSSACRPGAASCLSPGQEEAGRHNHRPIFVFRDTVVQEPHYGPEAPTHGVS